MKKNLVMSICMLALAALTLVGTTFAYFSSFKDSGGQNVTIGAFEFTAAAEYTQGVDAYFKASTIINFPEIQKPEFDTAGYALMTPEEKEAYLNAYNIAVTQYNLRGDDRHFNDYCLPVKITAQNNSLAKMHFAYTFGFTTESAVNILPALNWFVFDNTRSQALLSAGESANYAAELRAICNALDAGSLTDVGQINDARLSQGRSAMQSSLKNDVYEKDGKAETVLIVWLDYVKVRKILTEINHLPEDSDNQVGAICQFKLKMNLTVTASNEVA